MISGRVRQGLILPTAIQSRTTAMGEDLGLDVFSGTVANGNVGTIQGVWQIEDRYVLYGKILWNLFINDTLTDNILPQREGGANVGPDESLWDQVGPFDALMVRGKDTPLGSSEYASFIYLKNNTGSDATVFVYANTRLLTLSTPNDFREP